MNPSLCAVCAAENVAKICAVMGMEAETKEKKVAVVYCSGDHGHAKMIAQYNGLNDCRAAASLHGRAAKDAVSVVSDSVPVREAVRSVRLKSAEGLHCAS